MSCISDEEYDFSWTYDGNTEINKHCIPISDDVFDAFRVSKHQCDIIAWLANATLKDYVLSISGPYGCVDRASDGITSTSLVVVLGTFQHLLHLREIT